MNSKKYRELFAAYINISEQKIGVPTNNPDATLQKIIKSNPKYGGGEVIPSKPTKSANVEKAHLDLFDIVKGYLLGEGYVDTEEEALIMMSNMSEEVIQNIIEAAFQPSLITSKGKAQNFTKPNRVPFTSSTPVQTRSTTPAQPPRRPSGGFGTKPSGQLELPLNKPASTPQRSQQYKDIKRLTGRTGGGLMGTTKPTNLEPRAPKPAWKSSTTSAKPVAKPTTTSAKPVAKPTTTSAKPNVYRPGATVRATGPNMNKFPELQRFANQARKVTEPVSKVAGAVAALRNITPAGVAASVMAPRPTGDATLKGALKRGDYKPKQGPVNPDKGLTKSQSFDKSFKAARTSGAKQFTWNNKTYTTKMKESFEDLDLLQNYLVVGGYVIDENEAISLIENMGEDLIDVVSEDLEQRRKQLMQRQREGVSQFKERISARVNANRKRLAKRREREQLKSEIKREIAREAVGDAIKPENVIPLDTTSQQNLRSAMKPSGPPPMKVKQPQKTQPSSGFMKRMIQNTSNSPL
jgi:hypothetical protein